MEGFPPEEFAARRATVYDAIGTGAHAVVQGVGPVRGFEVFRQDNVFHYLCGVELPQCYLLLDGTARTAALYLPGRDAHPRGEGDIPGAEDVDLLKTRHGLDAVYPLTALPDHLRAATVLYTPHAPAEGRLACQDTLRHYHKMLQGDPMEAPTREASFRNTLRERFPNAELRDLSPIVDALRLLKSPRELDLMRRAGALTSLAVAEAMRATRPGVREYQLGAVADYVYRVNGVLDAGYRPIIAAGDNIWHAHYYRNDAELRDGDLVLMDYAPDVANYTSDIGRMWPVNGTYSPVQRQLYGFMVEYHRALLARIRPGRTPHEVLADAADAMRPVVESTAWAKPIYAEAARRTLTFEGHLSHTVGMAVHDVGAYFDRPMEHGLVFALDPQMWIPEEKLYVRVEDTVAVTAEGVEVLTPHAPLELDDVEALVRGSGMIQAFPPRFVR